MKIYGAGSLEDIRRCTERPCRARIVTYQTAKFFAQTSCVPPFIAPDQFRSRSSNARTPGAPVNFPAPGHLFLK